MSQEGHFLLYGLTNIVTASTGRGYLLRYILKVNGELDRIANPNYNRFT